MNKTQMIQELRALTQAGMSDCKAAIEHCQGDLQKSVDYLKTKGLNIADGRAGRVASEGVVQILLNPDPVEDIDVTGVMVEVNCQTDFVAKSEGFLDFVVEVPSVILDTTLNNDVFTIDMVEKGRRQVVVTTKENIVVRRWWVEQAFAPNTRVFAYVHSNQKIGVLLTLMAPDVVNAARDPQFEELGENIAMQIAAMSPLAVSADRLDPEVVERQNVIFQTQLQELNKPTVAWPKILEGKTRKWHTEACLLEQESVWLPKTTVGQIIKNVGVALGGDVKVINFIRCQVGEGIETKKDDLAEEVAKLTDGV